MKKIGLTFSLLLLITLAAFAQTPNPDYDPALAKKLHADDRGMKMYVLVILKTGPNQVTDKVKRDSLFAGHFANIRQMAAAGKLMVAGPLEKNEQAYRGIFILDVATFEEAARLLANDPTVSQQVFIAEYYQWYGSAALPEYLPAAGKINKLKF